MISIFRGLITTLKTTFRRPVTVQYPSTHLPLTPRYMGFPVLTWDFKIQEPYCTGCLVCARVCPTDVITVSMKDNPKAANEESHRRKIVNDFKLDISNCILCGLCVEFCNFDAIIMSDFHEEGSLTRVEQDLPLVTLLDMGKEMQDKGKFTPPPPKKRPPAKAKKDEPATDADPEKQES
ncbi:MAG: 4Fe-4S dicluster domain-containing protein [SAR202 cluster bacterium]|mgnify:FL=1|nr:4Fe-4S dicluster domain-containing protein [SAR202 cluster bacterium]